MRSEVIKVEADLMGGVANENEPITSAASGAMREKLSPHLAIPPWSEGGEGVTYP
jgi:hypothetical protein